MENFRFWDHICQKKYDEKIFEKINVNRNKHIAMCPCTKLQSIFGTSVFATKFAQKTLEGVVLGQTQLENNLI